MRAMDLPEWSLADTKRGVAAQPARSLSAAFRRALGRGARHLSRTLPDDPPGAADAAARPRGDAARPGGAGDLLGVVSNKTGDAAAARSRAARLDAIFRQPRRRRRRAGRQARLRPGPPGAGAERRAGGRRGMVCRRYRGRHRMRPQQRLRRRCCSPRRCPPRHLPGEFARFAPDLSFADEAGLFRGLQGLRFGARAHLRRRHGALSCTRWLSLRAGAAAPRTRGDHPCRPRNRRTFKTCS